MEVAPIRFVFIFERLKDRNWAFQTAVKTLDMSDMGEKNLIWVSFTCCVNIVYWYVNIRFGQNLYFKI